MKIGVKELSINVPHPSSLYYTESDWCKITHTFTKDTVTETREDVNAMYGYGLSISTFDVHGNPFEIKIAHNQGQALGMWERHIYKGGNKISFLKFYKIDSDKYSDKENYTYHEDTLTKCERFDQGERLITDETFTYHILGGRISDIDVYDEVRSSHKKMKYKYDGAGRLIKIEYSHQIPFYIDEATYDEQGRIIFLKHTDNDHHYPDTVKTTRYEYNKNGRLIKLITLLGPDEDITIISYRSDGLLDSIRYGVKGEKETYREEYIYTY